MAKLPFFIKKYPVKARPNADPDEDRVLAGIRETDPGDQLLADLYLDLRAENISIMGEELDDAGALEVSFIVTRGGAYYRLEIPIATLLSDYALVNSSSTIAIELN